jgi:hypothetical protein
MFGAAVPKAAIDKDGDFSTGERDIGDAAGLLQNSVINPVTQSNAIHLLPQRHFRVRSLLPYLRHAAAGIG